MQDFRYTAQHCTTVTKIWQDTSSKQQKKGQYQTLLQQWLFRTKSTKQYYQLHSDHCGCRWNETPITHCHSPLKPFWNRPIACIFTLYDSSTLQCTQGSQWWSKRVALGSSWYVCRLTCTKTESLITDDGTWLCIKQVATPLCKAYGLPCTWTPNAQHQQWWKACVHWYKGSRYLRYLAWLAQQQSEQISHQRQQAPLLQVNKHAMQACTSKQPRVTNNVTNTYQLHVAHHHCLRLPWDAQKHFHHCQPAEGPPPHLRLQSLLPWPWLWSWCSAPQPPASLPVPSASCWLPRQRHCPHAAGQGKAMWVTCTLTWPLPHDSWFHLIVTTWYGIQYTWPLIQYLKDWHRTHLAYAGKRIDYYYYYYIITVLVVHLVQHLAGSSPVLSQLKEPRWQLL